MLTVLALPLALLSVLCSTVALALLGALAWLDDGGVALREGRVGPDEEGRLLALAGRLRVPVLVLVFGISFAAGALLSLRGVAADATSQHFSVDASAPTPEMAGALPG